MKVQDSLEWLVEVSSRCRRMTEISIIAVRDAEEQPSSRDATLQATKVALNAHLVELAKLLPEDFPPSRLADLHRHIRFSKPHDFVDIAAFDIPDILEKAEGYAKAHKPSSLSGEIGSYLHSIYRARLDRELAISDPDFHGLVSKACILLGEAFRSKSGMSDDSDTNIGRAFKADGPMLQVPLKLETDTDRNFQRGTLLLMQGVRAFYRNTHAHSQIATTPRQAVHALIIISMLHELIDFSRKVDPHSPNSHPSG